MKTNTHTNFRHDLTDHALVGSTARECDEGGALVAIYFDDPAAGVKIGLRVRTLAQAEALVAAAIATRDALAEELEIMQEAPDEISSGVDEAREALNAIRN